jgi:tetratricopeptide (TPR) repeat protein
MASDNEHAAVSAPAPQGPAISANLRRRLQIWYTHGQEKAAAGVYDYATDMFSQCIEGDPASIDYVHAFLHNLHKKYNNNKKGAGFASRLKSSTLKALKKPSIKKDWPSILKTGLEQLKLNPWDSSTLLQVAHACEAMHCLEAQLAWLRAALDVDHDDPDINRLCAIALGKQGQFDQAIVCWARVEKARPGDEEAQRAISDMQVKKTEAQLMRRSERAHQAAAQEAAGEAEGDQPGIRLTRQQELQRAVSDNPADIESYIELAELHAREDRYPEAERILRGALEASGGELKVREACEDMGLRRARHQVQIAERRAASDPSEEAQSLALRMKQELNRQETDVFRARSERYPTVMSWKVELGLRLKRAGNYSEAIKVFQQATSDPRRRGTVHLELGECFQQIKQYKLAMSNYQAAVEALAERSEPEARKKALYRAGVLAMGLEDLNLAEKHLTELAGMEYGYRDVAERLDKLAEVRDKG